MKCYEIGAQDGLQALRLVQRPAPVPGPGQAVLRTRAACLNHRDLKLLQGSYGPRRPETRIPGSDGVGDVVAVGDGVPASWLGRRALFSHLVDWLDGAFTPAYFQADLGVSLDGWLAEQVVVRADALVAVPDSLSDAQAAPLCAAGLTAWNALVESGRLRAGERVLVQGTGGVAMLALQIARLQGAQVAVTSSSDAKLAAARALGADITINYQREPDWARAFLQASGGVGADLVVETGGQATLAESIAAAAPNGRIALIGALAGASATPLANFSSIVGKNLQLRGITVGSRAMLERLLRVVHLNALHPVIDCEFLFDATPSAFAHLARGQHLGKVLVRF